MMCYKKCLYLCVALTLSATGCLFAAAENPAPAVAPYTGTLTALVNTLPFHYLMAHFGNEQLNFAPTQRAYISDRDFGKLQMQAAGLVTAGSAFLLKLSPGLSLVTTSAAAKAYAKYNEEIFRNEEWQINSLVGNEWHGFFPAKHYHLWHGTRDYIGYKVQCGAALAEHSGQDRGEAPTPAQRDMLTAYICNHLLPERASYIGMLNGRKEGRKQIVIAGCIIGTFEFLAPKIKSLLVD